VNQNTKNTFSTILDNPISLNEFNLTADDGTEFNVAALKNKWSLLFFGYTHCPDVCPLTLHQLGQARKALSKSSDVLPNIIMISVDPDRDTTDILHKYVSSFSQPIIGATGLASEIDKLTSQLGIFYKTNKEEGENYSVSHSAAVVMINKNAEFHAVFSAPHSTEHFISDLPTIMANN
jgi:protein SCO1/2